MFDFIKRLFAQQAIRIEDGRARALKGTFPNWVLADISDLCQKRGLAKGEIWLDAGGRIRFASSVPESLHQRLRNVISSR